MRRVDWCSLPKFLGDLFGRSGAGLDRVYDDAGALILPLNDTAPNKVK